MKSRGFTFVEYAVMLTILLVVAAFALRIVYGHQIRTWEQSLSPARYLVTVPLFLLLLYGYWRKSAEQARALGQPVVRSLVWGIAAAGIALACAGILLV